jgi:hypothetical protein
VPLTGETRLGPVSRGWFVRDASRDLLVVALLVVLTVGINLPLLTKYPAPASDEANFVDPAVTLLRHGVLSD